MRKPYDYIISLGGKSFRRQFLFALNVWLEVDMESCEVIDAAIAMLHNSSLLYAVLKISTSDHDSISEQLTSMLQD